MNKLTALLLFLVCFNVLLINFSSAQGMQGLQIANKSITTYQYKNSEELNILNTAMNKVSNQEMLKLGNYSELTVYQNKHNQSILLVQKQSKFLNIFQIQRSYEYAMVDGILSYQNKWYDFLFKES